MTFSTRYFLLILAMVIAAGSAPQPVYATGTALPISQYPLFLKSPQTPLMMMVLSRDEQLFNKAYADYTDLNGDGVLDTTYVNGFEYSGYFDPLFCYDYASSQFKAVGAATNHQCVVGAAGGKWSGNFLNWLTMSRLDVLRWVLYGGKRSTDTATTVLERSYIPTDLHAWVKVYPTGASTPLNKLTPYTDAGAGYSFCNASFGLASAPLVRVAAGSWPQWASSAINQCVDRTGSNNTGGASADRPPAQTDYTARVQVCDATNPLLVESFCQKYTDTTTSVSTWKPVGVLQQYGEPGKVRFGLISGSQSGPRSGGILRRNIGQFAGNGTNPAACVAGDEVQLNNGTFCNQNPGDEGIVNNINRYTLQNWGGTSWNDCNTYGILNRQGAAGANGNLVNPGTGTAAGNFNRTCNEWGNPLSEMYAEALRYITAASATAAFTSTTGYNGTDIAGMPTPAWLDPYRAVASGGNNYCAKCSILVLSSGLNSFDSDEIPAVPQIASAATATTGLGTDEGIAGNYFVGRNVASQATLAVGNAVDTYTDKCTTKAVPDLALARGLCPDIPALEGSYLMSGLAYKAWTTDMRPGLQSKPASYLNSIRTYGVALAENLPKFDIQLGGAGKITLSPLCEANNSGGAVPTAATPDPGWRSCYLGGVTIGRVTGFGGTKTYGRPLVNGSSGSGSFEIVWEDSLWGNDHDNDVVTMITYCAGASCAKATMDMCVDSDSALCSTYPTVSTNQGLIRVENLAAFAGNAMLTGIAVTGSDADGVKREVLRPGGTDGSLLTVATNRSVTYPTWAAPKVYRYGVGASGAGLLQSPLWYAAKYGGFTDADNNGKPGAGEWDSQVPGTPDGYFLARDPSKLKDALDKIFDSVTSGTQPSGSQSDTGVRLSTGTASQTFATSFTVDATGFDWTGDLVANSINTAGATNSLLWNAQSKLTAQIGAGSRKIVIADKATDATAASAQLLTSSALGTTTTAKLSTIGLNAPYPTWLGVTPTSSQVDDIVAYLGGTSAKEIKNVGGKMRNRSYALGDMINSSPVVSSPKDDFGYVNAPTLGGGGAAYTTYVTTTKASRPTVVYVGANDGMLHAFNAKPCTYTGTPPVVVAPCPPTGAGDEMFAFIPNSVVGKLGQLPDPTYNHQYYVDGQINVTDAFYSAAWHTVLVGAAGAGGKGAFGLLVDNPSTFVGSNALWEINGSSDAATHGGNDIGYVYSTPQVILGENDQWYAVFGNGYNSVNGKAVLFIVDIATGAVKTITATDATDTATTSNGIGQIAAIDVNGDGRTDTVYGGDYHGRLWKFDLGIADITGVSPPSSWGVAFSGAPLFVAKDSLGNAQPITSGFEVAPGPLGGAMVYFGTGSYMLTSDNTPLATPLVQSLYAIWDPDPSIAPAIAIAVAGRASLQAQTINTQQSVGIYTTRTTSANGVTYTLAAGTQRGWYMDLKVATSAADGEMFFGTPRIQNGIVFYTAFEPKSDGCTPGGTRWEYGLSALTGASALGQVRVGNLGGASVCPSGGCGGLSLGDGSPVRNTSIVIPAPPCVPGFGTSCPILPVVCDPMTGICSPPTPPTDPSLYSACSIVVRTANDPTAPPLALPRPCGRQSWRQVR